jgi:hypothetical protein
MVATVPLFGAGVVGAENATAAEHKIRDKLKPRALFIEATSERAWEAQAFLAGESTGFGCDPGKKINTFTSFPAGQMEAGGEDRTGPSEETLLEPALFWHFRLFKD